MVFHPSIICITQNALVKVELKRGYTYIPRALYLLAAAYPKLLDWTTSKVPQVISMASPMLFSWLDCTTRYTYYWLWLWNMASYRLQYSKFLFSLDRFILKHAIRIRSGQARTYTEDKSWFILLQKPVRAEWNLLSCRTPYRFIYNIKRIMK